MRISAHILCLAASLAAAPAFAQAPSQPQSLSQAQKSQPKAEENGSPQFNFGLGLSKDQSERTFLPIGPIQKDSVALAWTPFNNWGLTLGITQRSPNDVALPREEVTAGITYQVTPRFRLGGGVTVKGDKLAEQLASPTTSFNRDGAEASVRIESAFSF
jgi:hypothetical protein